MAELSIDRDEIVGIKKEIDEGALGLIFSTLQEDIYSYPIKSFVRETISNALDSVIDKKIAGAIVMGNEPIDKYYRQEQDGKLLKDSAWDRSYYDFNYLSDYDKIEVNYEVREGRDAMIIKDEGIGLGGSRLKGFFSLGFSTKRNMKDIRGKFGLGSKAGLSTGVEYFIMTTVYNGYTTSFMIFKHDYDPITPEAPEGKQDVWEVTMADGTKVSKIIYWHPTTEKNGITVELPIKKHNRETFISAVKQQFSYFKGQVVFTYPYRSDDGYTTDSLDSDPLYESNDILIPDRSPYSVPHIIIDGINYGPVSWDELELENRQGSFAFKVRANEVDITANRESLKYTDKTKKVILSRIKLAKVEANAYISELLKTDTVDNLFANIKATLSISKNSTNEVAKAFSKFLDMYDIKPRITLEQFYMDGKPLKHRLNEEFFKFLFYHYTVVSVQIQTGRSKTKVVREKLEDFDDFGTSSVVFAKSSSLGPKKSIQLAESLNTDTFIYIRERTRENNLPTLNGNVVPTLINYMEYHVARSADIILDEVKFDFKEEESNSDVSTTGTTNWAKVRKMNEEVLFTEKEVKEGTDRYGRTRDEIEIYRSDRTTLKIRKIPEMFDKTTVVTTNKHASFADMLLISNLFNDRWHQTEVIYVSQDNLKHFLPHCTYITDHLKTYDPMSKTITLGDGFKDMNTIMKIVALADKYIDLDNIELLTVLGSFDISRYKKASDYSHASYSNKLNSLKAKLRSNSFEEGFEAVMYYLNSIAEIQDLLETASPEEVAIKSKELLGGEILHVEAYDKEFVDSVQADFERLAPLTEILKHTNVAYISDEDKDKFTNLVAKILPLIS